MSAEIDTRLRCDAPECDAVIEFVGGTAGRSLARTFAREYGWSFNSRGDFCPEHSERLAPPVEHKVTLVWDDCNLGCTCGWGSETFTDDPFEPARLAREHLAEQGEDR